MRGLAILLVAMLVGTALWFLSRPPRDGVPSKSAQGEESQPPSEDPVASWPDAQAERVEGPAKPTHADRLRANPASRGAFAPSDESTVEIIGRVVVVDLRGQEHSRGSGSFTAWILPMGIGSTPQKNTFVVENGGFRLQAPLHESLRVEDLVVDGRKVVLDKSRYDLSGGSVVIRGRWPRLPTLRVIDASSGLDLSDVTVIGWTSMFDRRFVHPGSYADAVVIIEHARSPFPVENPEREGNMIFFGNMDHRRVLVGAPQYAWKPVLLDFSVAGEHRVELELGADLKVQLVGELPTGRSEIPEVRLRAPKDTESVPTFEDTVNSLAGYEDSDFPGGVRPTDSEMRERHRRAVEIARRARGSLLLSGQARVDEPIEWRGLPPGEYEISAEMGQTSSNSLILATERVHLTAGFTREVTLHLIPQPGAPEKVPLSGTLLLAPGWQRGQIQIEIDMALIGQPGSGKDDEIHIRSGGFMPVAGSRGLYRWDADRVTPGRYGVKVFPFMVHAVIDTGPHGRSDARIEIAAPADVEIRLVSEDTGLVVTDLRLSWNGERTPGTRSPRAGKASWNDVRSAYCFRAPAAPVRVRLSTTTYGMDNPGALTLEPGLNSFTFQVRRLSRIVLNVTEAGRTVPFPDDWFFKTQVRCVRGEGTGRAASVSSRMGTFRPQKGTLRLTQGGLYEVTVLDLPGYHPISPFQLEVPDGETVKHTIEVTKN